MNKIISILAVNITWNEAQKTNKEITPLNI